jgi:hypothetical protein
MTPKVGVVRYVSCPHVCIRGRKSSKISKIVSAFAAVLENLEQFSCCKCEIRRPSGSLRKFRYEGLISTRVLFDIQKQ